jgi:hypothetical protein
VSELVGQINGVYAAKHGEDLFKPTNKTTQAFLQIRAGVEDA